MEASGTPVTLFRNEYFTVLFHASERVVEVVRSSVAFPSPEEVAPAFAAMLMLFDDLGRQRYSLLLDSREAVPNNQPHYEASYARFRADLHRGFRKIAVVVKTPAGNLQATRLLPTTHAPSRVFQDRDVAWEFVAEPFSGRTSSRPNGGEPPGSNSRR